MPLHLIIFGPQGSGKGTQAEYLATKYDLEHISTGAMFREEIASGSDLGKELQNSINTGILASDDIANRVISKKIKELNSEHKGFIFDGYPRTINQAEFIDHLDINHVFLLDIPDEESIERLQKRFKVASEEDKRVDDAKGESIRKRLDLYHQYTKSLINFYEDKGLLRTINGSLSIEEVSEAISDIVKEDL